MSSSSSNRRLIVTKIQIEEWAQLGCSAALARFLVLAFPNKLATSLSTKSLARSSIASNLAFSVLGTSNTLAHITVFRAL